MKNAFVVLLLILPVFTFSQNVGVGTSTPVTKLNIVGNGSAPAIPGTTSAAIFRIGVGPFEGIDFGKLGTAPFSAWMQAGFNGSVPDPIALQPQGGNVGIGTISPAEKLDVNGHSSYNGTMKLQGLNLFEFGAGVAGKEINAGKIGYNAFGQSALTFIGAGTNISNRAVYFFAEGGTTMNGPLNIEGPFRVNGNPGTTGQVLTSNGTADPAWRNSALTSTTRFAASFIGLFPSGPPAETYSTIYNLNPADITIGTNSITINKAGLYHIEGYLTREASFLGTPSLVYSNFSLNLGSNVFEYDAYKPFSVTNSAANFKLITHFSQDIHFSASATINLSLGFGFVGGLSLLSRTETGKITGYLIAD